MSEPEKKKKKKPSGKKNPGLNKKPEILVKHLCVDCGKPTPDHRCHDCLMKWRMKHGVGLMDSFSEMDM